jgi:hypothetical protein
MKSNHVLTVQLAIALALIICIVGATTSYAVTPAATCLTLSAEQSEDKNYYRFTATASNDTVTGYEFDFGDKQSYTFDVQDTPGKDKKTATVKHTYEKNGIYTATTKIIDVDKKKSQSSATCSTQIVIGQVTMLPVTGPDGALPAITLIAVGLAIYGILLIQKPLRQDDDDGAMFKI